MLLLREAIIELTGDSVSSGKVGAAGRCWKTRGVLGCFSQGLCYQCCSSPPVPVRQCDTRHLPALLPWATVQRVVGPSLL